MRRSVATLAKLANVRCLLASWDDPRYDEAITNTMNAGLAWLDTIEHAVDHVTATNRAIDPRELCRLVAAKLGLPPVAVNPLVAASFVAEKARVVQR